jgi:hypothetical protein
MKAIMMSLFQRRMVTCIALIVTALPYIKPGHVSTHGSSSMLHFLAGR